MGWAEDGQSGELSWVEAKRAWRGIIARGAFVEVCSRGEGWGLDGNEQTGKKL